MKADEHAYRVTYRSGRVAICNRKSLSGKIGLHNSDVRSWYRIWPSHQIVKIERSPLFYEWQDATAEFTSLLEVIEEEPC